MVYYFKIGSTRKAIIMKHNARVLALFLMAISLTSDAADNAILFTGTTDYASIPNVCVSGVTASLTLEAKICFSGANPSARIIDNIAVGNVDGFLLDLVNGAPRVLIGPIAATAPSQLLPNTWYQIAATYDGDTMRLYVNGVATAKSASSAAVPANAYDIRVGIDRNSASHFTGVIDEVRIWSIARSQSDIQSFMGTTLAGTEAGLAGYWQFNEQSGTMAQDFTMHHNDATLKNFVFGGVDGWIPVLSGTGTDAAPYLVADYPSLKLIGTFPYVLSGSYRVTSDIDASPSSSENAGAGFAPIGDSVTQFTGKFHGSGHVIGNLFIHRATANHIGLFGYSSGTVDSVGTPRCAIVGQNTVGGVVGENKGIISNCYSTGTISGAYMVGGLVGANDSLGLITYCYAAGNVSGATDAGGLVGWIYSGIDHSYATGAVSGTSNTGGLVGEGFAEATYCYATGAVTGTTNVGGLIGYCGHNVVYSPGSPGYSHVGFASYSYATGYVSGSTDVGGLFGLSNFWAPISVADIRSRCCWNMKTTGQSSCCGAINANYPIGASGLTTAQMKDSSQTDTLQYPSTWIIRNDSTYPGLIGVDNAPFAFADSLTTTGTFALSQLLLNDYDIETDQQHLVLKVQALSAGTTDSVGTLTFPASGVTADTVTYRVGEVRAKDTLWGNCATSVIFLAPQPPTAVSPVNNAANVPVNSSIAWTKVPGAVSYRLQIATDSLFAFKRDTSVTDTSVALGVLVEGAKYFWHVNVTNAICASEWSPVYRFTTASPDHARAAAIPKAFGFAVSGQAGIVRYCLPKAQQVSLRLYGMNGQLTAEIVRKVQNPGYYSLGLQKSVRAGAAYLVVFKAGEYCRKTMVFLIR
jgi:Concanavalin A-like lectin/glucanases superfamily/The GLUG motif